MIIDSENDNEKDWLFSSGWFEESPAMLVLIFLRLSLHG